MGLAERRAAKDFEDTQYPLLQKEIVELAGFAVPIEVDWNQIAADGYAHMYKEAWPEVYFKPVIEGLRQITRDAMGKDALKSALKKIELRNSSGAYSPQDAISFTNGALVIDHAPVSNVDDTKERTRYVVEVIEKGL